MTINRYSPASEGSGLMKHDPKGEYVKYQDHESLLLAKELMMSVLRASMHKLMIVRKRDRDAED